MFYNFLFLLIIPLINAERDSFADKCSRKCDSRQGTSDCWKRTTDGFTYGLSTAMVDYCQLIRHLDAKQWFNITQNILLQQIEQYDLNSKVRQLTKHDIQEISLTLVQQCFQSYSPSLPQPPCPSCTNNQLESINIWRYLSVFLTSFCLILFLVILLLYTFHTRYARHSYQVIS